MKNKMSLSPKTATKLNLKKVIIFTLLGGGVFSMLIYIGLTFFGIIGKPTEAFAANGLGYSWDAAVSIDHTKVSGQTDLIDFPLLIKVVNPNLQSVTTGGRVESINGYDIVFADMNDNLLDHQMESYNPTTGELVAWVRIPVLSASANTGLKLFYGNPAITTNQSTEDVWNGNYEGVWHMSDNPSNGDMIDAAGVNDATGFGSLNANSVVPGKIGLGTDFNGSNDYYAIKNKKYNTSGAITNLTVSGWFKTTYSHSSWTNNWALLDFDRSEYFNLFVHANGKVGFSTRGSGQGSGINDFYVGNAGEYNDGNWHFVAGVYDGANKYIYVDGILKGTKTNPHQGNPLGTGATRYGFIGDGSEATSFSGTRNNKYYDGEYDEIRLSNAALSAGWLATVYANQNTPDSFTNIVFGTSPLPVELVGFNVMLKGESVEISWSTATEINNDYFTIEKSADAVNYEYVDEVTGAGNSNSLKTYNYIDDSFSDGVTYYRLKQTDFDGEFIYFPPKSINQEELNDDFNIISVGPNPFSHKFSINIQSEKGGVAELTLSDLNGNNIHTSQIGINEGRTTYTYMQGGKLASGTYIINLLKEGKKLSYKIVKQ